MSTLIWSVVGALLIVLGVAFLGSVVAWIVTARHVERDAHADMVKALLAPDALDRQDPDEIDRQWADVDRWMRDLRDITPQERAREIAHLEALWAG